MDTETAITLAERVRTQSQDRWLAELASNQHGIVGRRQLLAAGMTSATIGRRLASGRLHQIHRNAYALGHTSLTADGHWLAAVFAAGDGAVLSHRSAAALWGFRPTERADVELTTPGRRPRMAGIHAHAHRLSLAHVTVRRGIPVTTNERTILDLASVISAESLRRAIDRAEELRLLDWATLRALASRADRRRGARALRLLLADRTIGTGVTRSDLERDFLSLLRRHSLPLPETNVWIEGYEVDCLWRHARLAIELDGRETHATLAAFEDDRRRDRELVTAGWRPIRITYRQVHFAEASIVADLMRLLDVETAMALADRARAQSQPHWAGS